MATKRTTLKRLGLFFLLLIAGALVYGSYEHFRGKAHLRSWVAEQRVRGERFTLAEMELPTPSEGGTTQSLEITEETAKDLDSSSPTMVTGLPTLKLVAPGKALVVLQLTEIPKSFLVAISDTQVLKPRSWTEIEQEAAASQPVLARIRKTLDGPVPVHRVEYSKGIRNCLTPT
jgi:hypothetical protein